MNLIDYSDKIQQAQAKRTFTATQIRDCEQALAAKKDYLLALEEAQAFLQGVAKQTQEQLRFHIRDIVNLCMQAIWTDEIEFDIAFEIKNGRTAAKLVFTIGGEEVDLLENDGGGCVDVAAFGLRIAIWSLGNTRNTIILDEAFKHLSDDLQPLAAKVVKELSDKLHLQFIQVTHRKEMVEVADRIFEVNRKKVGDYYMSEVKAYDTKN